MNKKAWMAFRIVIGGYLAYLGVRLLLQIYKEGPSNGMAMGALAVVFILVGAGYAVMSLKSIWKNYWEEQQDGEGYRESGMERKRKEISDISPETDENIGTEEGKRTKDGDRLQQEASEESKTM